MLILRLILVSQGMNLNRREMVQHVEYEPDTYYAAFSAELEICSSPMWSLLAHLHEEVRLCSFFSQYCSLSHIVIS